MLHQQRRFADEQIEGHRENTGRVSSRKQGTSSVPRNRKIEKIPDGYVARLVVLSEKRGVERRQIALGRKRLEGALAEAALRENHDRFVPESLAHPQLLHPRHRALRFGAQCLRAARAELVLGVVTAVNRDREPIVAGSKQRDGLGRVAAAIPGNERDGGGSVVGIERLDQVGVAKKAVVLLEQRIVNDPRRPRVPIVPAPFSKPTAQEHQPWRKLRIKFRRWVG